MQRLRENSQLVATTLGPIEYGVAGEGAPVLFIHGTPGGYDQGLAAADMFIGPGYTILSPSRPGYLRTPLSSGASLEDQADLMVAQN